MSAPNPQGKPGDPQWNAWDRPVVLKALPCDTPFNENFDYETLLKVELSKRDLEINQPGRTKQSGSDRTTASQPQAASLSKVED